MNSDLDLVLTREIDAPASLLWQAWTTPEHLMKWWSPAPVMTTECEMDVRPGGIFRTLMVTPDGTEYPTLGCFLETVENQRLTFTDALQAGFRPASRPFFTATITLEDLGGKTRYTAHAFHKDAADRLAHEQMGFYDGWGTALNQLVTLVESMKAGSDS